MFQWLVLQVIYSSVILHQELLGNTAILWHGVVAHVLSLDFTPVLTDGVHEEYL